MYLVIQNGTKSKSYQTTNDCSKPYLKLKDGAQIPLTTNTTNGFYYNVKSSGSHTGADSYLTTEYESSGMSSTTALTSEASDTFYSSAVNSEGMSETTALTCESTSSTIYGTKFDGYIFRSSRYTTKSISSYSGGQQGTWWRTEKGAQSYIFSGQVFSSMSAYNPYAVMQISGTGADDGSGNSRFSSTYWDTATDGANNIRTYYGTGTRNSTIMTMPFPQNSRVSSSLMTTEKATNETGQYQGQNLFYRSTERYTLQVSGAVKTTGTTYLTRESTSGYSGVSSSSSEATTAYSGYTSSQVTIYNTDTMRPMEYVNETSTWYTTAVQSAGLSETTALTRESISSTEYVTNTESCYGSATWYRTINTTMWQAAGRVTATSLRTSDTLIFKEVVFLNYGISSINLKNGTHTLSTSSYSKKDSEYYNTEGSYTYQGDLSIPYGGAYGEKQQNTSGITITYSSSESYPLYVTSNTTQQLYVKSLTQITKTTNTIYHTCSSTSGYSGISSSGSFVWK